MQFFCKQINYIVRQIFEKDPILLIIQIQTSGFAVGRLNHTPLAWKNIVFKLSKAFKFKSHINFIVCFSEILPHFLVLENLGFLQD
jgi:hypothetical protein